MLSELNRVIEEISSLPGIGRKSAARLAFHFLRQSPDELKRFTGTLHEFHTNVDTCNVCGSLKSSAENCHFCESARRDRSTICVVEQPSDIYIIENTGEYNGLYHVLNGVLNPLDGISPEDIRINELIERLNADSSVNEIIVATNPSVEGNATAHYIAASISSGIKVTRIATGLALGSQLDYADSVSVSQSLRARTPVET